MTEETAPPRPRRIAILLWLLPLWLVISSCIGIFLHLRGRSMLEKVEQPRFATVIGADLLADDMVKLTGFVGERHVSGPAGVQGLNRAAAMIEGSLGPGNAGYDLARLHAPATPAGTWPVITATLRGRSERAAPLWVAAAYDARPGSVGAEANATGVSSVLAVAHALANVSPERSVHFAFLPHAYDEGAPVTEMLGRFAERADGASAVLVVEATGAAGSLLVSSRDAGNPALSRVDGLGEVAGAEAICLEDDFDLSSVLFEFGLPAVRVSTRPVVRGDESDAGAPDPAVHAAATRALVTLIERLAGL